MTLLASAHIRVVLLRNEDITFDYDEDRQTPVGRARDAAPEASGIAHSDGRCADGQHGEGRYATRAVPASRFEGYCHNGVHTGCPPFRPDATRCRADALRPRPA